MEGNPLPSIVFCVPGRGQRRLPDIGDLLRERPSGVGRAQRHHIGHLRLQKSFSEAQVLCVVAVGEHGPKRNLHLQSLLDQLEGYLQLGPELGILFAAFEVMFSGV